MTTQKRDPFRELATVTHATYGKEDHGILTCSIGLNFGGSHQSFGNLALDASTGTDFVKSVCELFGVGELNQTVGKECYALRCFGEWSSPIEGLESLDAKRFLLTEWRRKFYPNTKDPLEDAVSSKRLWIASTQRRLREEIADLASIESRYRPVTSAKKETL